MEFEIVGSGEVFLCFFVVFGVGVGGLRLILRGGIVCRKWWFFGIGFGFSSFLFFERDERNWLVFWVFWFFWGESLLVE